MSISVSMRNVNQTHLCTLTKNFSKSGFGLAWPPTPAAPAAPSLAPDRWLGTPRGKHTGATHQDISTSKAFHVGSEICFLFFFLFLFLSVFLPFCLSDFLSFFHSDFSFFFFSDFFIFLSLHIWFALAPNISLISPWRWQRENYIPTIITPFPYNFP